MAAGSSCVCKAHLYSTVKLEKHVLHFTDLLLHCWQTEYDKRPYHYFQFRRLDFEERLGRPYHITADLRTIVKYLQKRPQISVSIWNVPICMRDARLIKSFVQSLIHLSTLELKLMDLPLEFFVMLVLNAKQLRIFDLSLEGSVLNDAKLQMLRRFLIESERLRSLNVASCNITQYNFAVLADGIYKSKKVYNLDCSRIVGMTLSLDSEKICSTLCSLMWQNRLIELTLQHCELTAQDIELMSEYLQLKGCKIRKLNVSNNKIAADGTHYLMYAIVKCGTLEWLDISCNGIGTHGGECVAENLSSCKMLQYLYINYNEIGAGAINLILLTMKKPVKLIKLSVYGNQFNGCSGKILRRLLDAHVLSQNDIDICYTYDTAINDYRVIPWRN